MLVPIIYQNWFRDIMKNFILHRGKQSLLLSLTFILLPSHLLHSSPPTSFRRDVMPVFFRAGCNAGTCHGSSRGKDGFMLSLFGYDASGDYFRLTEEMIGRRVNVAEPTESLMLLKATGKVPHTGGKRFSEDSPYYETLLQWIEAGAPNDAADVPMPVEITLEPERLQFVVGGDTTPTKVTARLLGWLHA